MKKNAIQLQKPKVFIGSSSEGVAAAEAIQLNLHHQIDTVIWTQGFFRPSETTLGALINRLNDFDFAVFLFTADDKVLSRKKLHFSPRDNLIFEFGLFIGELGLARTYIVRDRSVDLKLASDLAGLVTADFSPPSDISSVSSWQQSLGPACSSIKSAIQTCRVPKRTSDLPSAIPTRLRPTVEIFYHPRTFTRRKAEAFEVSLINNQLPCRILEHCTEDPPDAVFIGSLVTARDAQFVLKNVPYTIKYLFRSDYPDSEGGDGSGLKIGVGYVSTYNAGSRPSHAEPAKIDSRKLARLCDPRLSNAAFHSMLFEITRP